MFTKQLVKVTHSNNLLNEELVETNHSSNMFVKKLVQFNIIGLTSNNLIERRTNSDLSNLELGETDINDLLKK
jgi:hypothetical protein